MVLYTSTPTLSTRHAVFQEIFLCDKSHKNPGVP